MKQIKTFVQKNQMTVLVGVIMLVFSTWMYSAYNNIQERDAQREARIEYLSRTGGTHYPSASITVDKSYVAAE